MVIHGDDSFQRIWHFTYVWYSFATGQINKVEDAFSMDLIGLWIFFPVAQSSIPGKFFSYILRINGSNSVDIYTKDRMGPTAMMIHPSCSIMPIFLTFLYSRPYVFHSLHNFLAESFYVKPAFLVFTYSQNVLTHTIFIYEEIKNLFIVDFHVGYWEGISFFGDGFYVWE